VSYRKIIFVLLLIVAALGAGFLFVVAQLDMAEMRTVRSAFNFDGIFAIIAGILIAAGIVVLFIVWRVLVFSPDTALRDIKIWIGGLLFLLVGLHGVFVYSYLVDLILNTEAVNGLADAIRHAVSDKQALTLVAMCIWPVPVMAGLGYYHRKIAKSE